MNRPLAGKFIKDKKLTFGRYAGFFEELTALYVDMDQTYNDAAAYYGFQCAGCEDNCCLTRFYHHTNIERLYLLSGFFKLDVNLQDVIRDRAQNVNHQLLEAQSQGKTSSVMCALNEEGRCLLYAHRPMICRLHGIPHELRTPGRPPVHSPGCADFVRRCGDQEYKIFDRTPFYQALAILEQRFKEQFHMAGKIKRTVSEMLILEESIYLSK